jgi:hypothetical protein
VGFLNWRLLSHPFNWLFIWIVLAGAAIAFTAIHEHYSSADASNVIPA